MSPQFKKFLVFVTSIVLGSAVFILLTKISINTHGNFNAGPALGFFYVPISIGSMVGFYKFLKKSFIDN